MKDATKRSIVRGIHIVFSIPILGAILKLPPFERFPGRIYQTNLPVTPGLRTWST